VSRRTCRVVAAIAMVAAAPAALAEPAAQPVPGRLGLTAGFDAGLGEMSLECALACENSLDHSGAVAVHAGWMFEPTLAIVYDGWLLVHRDDSAFGNVLALHSLHVAALQGWLLPRLWVRGGPGIAHMRIRFGEIGTRSDVVPALSASVGFEAMQFGRMVLDVTLRVGAGFYDEDEGQDGAVYNAALGAGLSWY
jgi:hypothetical protein